MINGNTAAYGGGVDILTFEDGADANVRLFTTDPYHPVQITDNFASRTGGAFYLKPLSTLSEFTKANLCAYDFRINDNAAQEGSAIYSDADYSAAGNIGGYVTLNPPEEDEICSTQPEPPTTLGAVSCASGVACNELVGNIAEDSDSRPTAGSTILIQNAGQLNADRFSARANTGAHVVRELADRPV